MRPIVRGRKPSGLVMKHWQDAAEPLRARIGSYCSYCEKPLSDITDVEHVQPKKYYPNRKLEWENFLLACSSCNRIKGAKPQDALSNYVLPDSENPLLYLQYHPLQLPTAHRPSDPAGEQRMARTIELVGLARDKTTQPRATGKDRRWIQRQDVWKTALKARDIYDRNPSKMADPDYEFILKKLIVASAFFSVWLSVFQGVPSVVSLILDSFPGTDRSRFNAQGDSV